MKETAEAHLYTTIKVARDEDLRAQIGREVIFDLVDHDKVRSFRVKKQMRFNIFKRQVAEEFGIPVQFQRFWLWAKRQNRSYRPNRPLRPQEEVQAVGRLREVSSKANPAELNLFLEVEVGQDLHPIPPPVKSNDEILLFFKLYDPLKQELRYAGRLFVRADGKPLEILRNLNKFAGFAPGEKIKLFEEIKFEPCVMCVPIDKDLTFRDSELEDGDIICFQKSPQLDRIEQFRYPDVPSYLQYVHNCPVDFRSLGKPKEDEFCDDLNQGAEQGGQAQESQHPSSGNEQVEAPSNSEEVGPRRQDLCSAETQVNEEAKRVPSDSTVGVSSPSEQPLLHTQTPPVNGSDVGSSNGTLVGSISTIPRAAEHSQASDSAGGPNDGPAGKVRFLSYWVSSRASLVLKKAQDHNKDTFVKFSMNGPILQTVVLETFTSFIESMSSTKVSEMGDEAFRSASVSIEDFEQVGLNLSWLKQRLDEAKRINRHSASLVHVDLCNGALELAWARIRKLEEALTDAEVELQARSRDLPKSLGVDDSVLKDVI